MFKRLAESCNSRPILTSKHIRDLTAAGVAMLGFRHVCHLTLISLCIAADLKNTHFTNPPAAGSETFYDEDVTFHLNSNERLQWTTDMSSYSIYLWQQVLTEAAAKVGDAIFGMPPSSHRLSLLVDLG